VLVVADYDTFISVNAMLIVMLMPADSPAFSAP
jgi:hypothetical protein